MTGQNDRDVTRPIPPDLLLQIEAHERWLETSKKEGKALVQGNRDLHDLDLTGRGTIFLKPAKCTARLCNGWFMISTASWGKVIEQMRA